MKLPWDARDKRKQDLEEEIQSHLQMSARDREARGEPADQAAASARRELGNAALVREVTHDQWRWGWLDSLWQDVRFAARCCAKVPASPLSPSSLSPSASAPTPQSSAP
jgi:hypothetical protein